MDSIGDLILIFSLNLSINSSYYQGGRIWTNFKLSKCFTLRWYSWESRTSLTKHSAQSFCTGSDDPGLPQIIRPNSVCHYWVSPDDPALVRMIRAWGFVSAWKGQAGWSGPTPDGLDLENSSVFWAYSVTTPDDPRLLRMIRETPENTQRSLSGGGSIYTPSPPSFTSLSLSLSLWPTTPP